MFSGVFDELIFAKVFAEYSEISDQDLYHLRLNDFKSVEKVFKRSAAPLLVAKPIVESQNANDLLERFEDSHGVWLFRNYIDVASSNLRRFGDNAGAINNIRPLVDAEFARNDWTEWLTEHVGEDTKQVIKRFYAPDMNPADAAVLFWYVRNRLYFEQHLDQNDKITTIDYDEFVNKPRQHMQVLFNNLSLSNPIPRSMFKNVHSKSVNKGKALVISKDIEALADGLLKQLREHALRVE
jgi:hypothetical protein